MTIYTETTKSYKQYTVLIQHKKVSRITIYKQYILTLKHYNTIND